MSMSTLHKTAAKAAGVVVFMGALAWAAVPMYDWFCRVTGYGGTTNAATTGSDVVLDKTIKVRFDASLERDMPWEFKPVQKQMEVRIGGATTSRRFRRGRTSPRSIVSASPSRCSSPASGC